MAYYFWVRDNHHSSLFLTTAVINRFRSPQYTGALNKPKGSTCYVLPLRGHEFGRVRAFFTGIAIIGFILPLIEASIFHHPPRAIPANIFPMGKYFVIIADSFGVVASRVQTFLYKLTIVQIQPFCQVDT